MPYIDESDEEEKEEPDTYEGIEPSAYLDMLDAQARQKRAAAQPTPQPTPQVDLPVHSAVPEENPWIRYSPLGIAAKEVEIAQQGIGSAMNFAGKVYKKMAGPVAHKVSEPAKTFLGKVVDIEQSLAETPLKKALLLAERKLAGMPTEGLTPSWANVAYYAPGAQHMNEGVRRGYAKTFGVIGEPLLDPVLFAKPLGLTKAGVAAEKIGMLEPNVAKAAQAGQQNLLTVAGRGVVPEVINKPIMKAIGAGQTGMRKAFPGYHTMTEDAKFNALVERTKTSPTSYANIIADREAKWAHDVVKKSMPDMPEADINRLLAEYLEPTGSQKKFKKGGAGFNVEGARAAIGEKLPQDVKSILDKYIEEGKRFAVSENLGAKTKSAYLEHNATPEFLDFMNNNMNKPISGKGVSAAPKSQAVDAEFKRMVGDGRFTVNEINNLAAEGKLGTVMPRFRGVWDQYRGKVFDDNVVRIHNKRFLDNVKVKTTADMMDAAEKTYGKTSGALEAEIQAGKTTLKDWYPVKYQGKETFYPTEIGKYLDGIQSPAAQKFAKTWPAKFLRTTTSLTKFWNFGVWPKSAFLNDVSNQHMLFLNGMFTPQTQMKSHMIIAKYMRGKPLSDAPIIKSPIYGEISEKQLVEAAHKNRSIGQGQYKAELEQAKKVDPYIGALQRRGGKWSRGVWNIHEYSENSSRIGGYMRALEQGYTWDGAGMKVRRSVYDYGDLGPQDVANAQYFPFYRFARLNTPAMMGKVVTEPGKVAVLEKTRRAWNVSQEKGGDERLMSEWEKEGVPVYVGTDDKGQPLYWYSERFFPLNDLNRIFPMKGENTIKKSGEYVFSMLNPFIKTPIETALNKMTYIHQPIDKLQEVGGKRSETVKVMPGVNLPAKVAYALRQFRLIPEIQQAANEQVPGWARTLRSTLGFNIRPFSKQKAISKNIYQYEKKHGNISKVIERFAREEARLKSLGDSQGAQAAHDSMISAILDYQDAVKELPIVK